MQLNTVGIAGEMRCVITKADGSIKTDTGYQKNLILNQGLDFFGGGKGSNINAYCAIGAGNSAPLVTQTRLDAYITQASGTNTTSDYSYVDDGSGLYKMWEQKQYRFTGLNNVNISECGLVSTGTTSANYYLTTRVLIKDSLGNPTTITVLSGETLDIYYKIHKVIDVTDKSFVINVLDGDGGAVPYNAVIRPAMVGDASYQSVSTASTPFTYGLRIGANELATVQSHSGGEKIGTGYTQNSSYQMGTYKNTFSIYLELAVGNMAIRSFTSFGGSGSSNYTFLQFQMRLGRVSDDAPLTKTANDTLTIPLEFSWGRYDGVL